MHYKEVCTATEQYKVVCYYSIVHTNIALCQLSTYSIVLGIPKLYKYVPLYTRSESVLVCTWYVLGTYWYVLVHTRRNKTTNAQNIWIRTIYLMHSILRAITLLYQHAFHGDMYG
jgi:hypothetical protein